MLLLCAVTAKATVLYSFAFSASPTYTTPTFSITTPDFLTASGAVTIQPFTITNGTSTWTFTKAYVSPLCFDFATANGSVGFSGNPAFCTAGAGLANSGMIVTNFFSGGSPTQGQTGTFTGFIAIDTWNATLAHTSVTQIPLTVTISQIPEPAVGLGAGALLLLALLRKTGRRKSPATSF